MGFLDLLRGSKPDTVPALTAALADAKAAQEAAERAIGDLSEQRAAALLSGDDDRLDAVEVATTRAYRDADRAALGIGELEKRLASARAREHAGRLDELYREGIDHQQAAAAALRKFSALAADAARLLSEVEVRKARIRDILEDLRAAGDQRPIFSPESLVSTVPNYSPPIAPAVKLPDPERPGYPFWPLQPHNDFGRDRAQTLGFVLPGAGK